MRVLLLCALFSLLVPIRATCPSVRVLTPDLVEVTSAVDGREHTVRVATLDRVSYDPAKRTLVLTGAHFGVATADDDRCGYEVVRRLMGGGVAACGEE